MSRTTFNADHLARIKALPGLFEELTMNFDDFTIINNTKRLRGCICRAARLMRQYGAEKAAAVYMARAADLRGKHLEKEQINVILLTICLELKIGAWITPVNTLDWLGGLPEPR